MRVYTISKTAMRLALLAPMALASAVIYPGLRDAAYLLLHRGEPSVVADFRTSFYGPADYVASIDAALAADDPDLASSFVALASDHGVSLPQSTVDRVKASSGFDVSRTARQTWKGLYEGNTDTPAAFFGSLVSDLGVVGDVRDLSHEIASYPHYDSLKVAFAAYGLAASGMTWSTAFSGLPVKAGISMLKAAEKANRLPTPFRRELEGIAERIVDTTELKNAASSVRDLDTAAALSSAGRILRTEELGRLRSVAGDMGGIAYSQGFGGTMQSLSVAQSARELHRMQELSAAKGIRFRAIMTFLGNAAKLTVTVTEIVIGFVWTLLGAAVWLACAAWSTAGLGRSLVRHLRSRSARTQSLETVVSP